MKVFAKEFPANVKKEIYSML